MSVLVYIDTLSGKITKSGMEAVQYGSKIGETTVITNGAIDANQLAQLGGYGASKVSKAFRSFAGFFRQYIS